MLVEHNTSYTTTLVETLYYIKGILIIVPLPIFCGPLNFKQTNKLSEPEDYLRTLKVFRDQMA